MAWFPPAASDFALQIDRLFDLTLGVTLPAAVAVHGLLLIAILRKRNSERSPGASGGDIAGGRRMLRYEGIAVLTAAGVLVGMAFLSESVWARLRSRRMLPVGGKPALVVEVVGEQFAWNVRYAGSDGIFGQSDYSRCTVDNPLGLTASDPASRDDVIMLNRMRLPIGRTVCLRLKSKDVVHNFFVPAFRFKQDALPGLTVDMAFTPTAPGDYEIACSQFCGMAHYRMRGFLKVSGDREFEEWLQEESRKALSGGP